MFTLTLVTHAGAIRACTFPIEGDEADAREMAAQTWRNMTCMASVILRRDGRTIDTFRGHWVGEDR